MLQKIMCCATLVLLLSACAASHTRHDTNPAYSGHQYNAHDVDIAWQSEKALKSMSITGTVTNPRYESNYEGFELTATLLDENKKNLAKDTFRFSSGSLTKSEAFKLNIPVDNLELVRSIKFFYTYGIGEDQFSGSFVSVP